MRLVMPAQLHMLRAMLHRAEIIAKRLHREGRWEFEVTPLETPPGLGQQLAFRTLKVRTESTGAAERHIVDEVLLALLPTEGDQEVGQAHLYFTCFFGERRNYRLEYEYALRADLLNHSADWLGNFIGDLLIEGELTFVQKDCWRTNDNDQHVFMRRTGEFLNGIRVTHAKEEI